MKSSDTNSGRFRSRRGAVLLMVLVLISIVSFVLIQFIKRANVEVKSEGYYVERAYLRLQAWSMMETAVGVLADVQFHDGALFSPSQGWSDPLEYAQVALPEGLSARFEFIDESGKMGINEIDEASLFLLFDRMGFEQHISLQMVSTLLDWIDEDDQTRIDGAESKEYSQASFEMHPSNRPLRSLDELYSIVGFREHFFDENGVPNDKFRQLEEVFTVRSVQTVNINSAAPATLESLVGLNELQITSLGDYFVGRDGVAGTEDDNYFASQAEISDYLGDLGEGVSLSNEISILTIKVTVHEGGSAFSLIGTMNTQSSQNATNAASSGNLSYPFLFLEVREQPGIKYIESPIE